MTTRKSSGYRIRISFLYWVVSLWTSWPFPVLRVRPKESSLPHRLQPWERETDWLVTISKEKFSISEVQNTCPILTIKYLRCCDRIISSISAVLMVVILNLQFFRQALRYQNMF
ncbi:hypothetical protein RvY_01106 [Ramazzottius varieornatus]|uniref:Uncharacterized protein n=1 Tax=Ramazzottius varieornatus TaxID=947166 RepID=A0A1D1UQG1_RAMVA|nr:hypothetical protein RvY_01106 [Ramazzottius varieornatus]